MDRTEGSGDMAAEIRDHLADQDFDARAVAGLVEITPCQVHRVVINDAPDDRWGESVGIAVGCRDCEVREL